jgi:hypothetical protein
LANLSCQPTENIFNHFGRFGLKAAEMCISLKDWYFFKLLYWRNKGEYEKINNLKTENKLLLLGALGAGAFWLYSKTRALGDLIFSPGAVTGAAFSGSSPLLNVTILVQNTSGSSLQLNSFAGNVLSNGNLIGNVSNFSPITIPGNSQLLMPVTLLLQPIGIVNDIIQAVQNSHFIQNISIKGQANVNNFQLPVNVNFSVGS